MTRLPTLDRHRDRVETAKRLFPRACVAAGLPEPVAEHAFALAVGRRWRWDYAWPEARVALEVEGGGFRREGYGAHTTGAALRRDCEKHTAGAVLGWRLLRVLPEHLLTTTTLDNVRRALAGAQEG